MPNVLCTDEYKFSMAKAGYPLRQETFYYAHRRGGRHLMPLDAAAHLTKLLPTKVKTKNDVFDAAFGKPHRSKVEIEAVNPGCWFYDREPAIIVRGPSACVSWLEPQILQLNYRIQIATLARTDMLHKELKVTCVEEKEIIEETLEGIKYPGRVKIRVCPEEYSDAVRERAKALVSAVPDPAMLFEVGFRSVSCLEQHRLALTAIKEAGINKTSNSLLAKELEMTSVGTMGHEHPQRFFGDYEAFTAMRDRSDEINFYLPDTYDALKLGIPAAIRAILEAPNRECGIRFDSDDVREQYTQVVTLLKTPSQRDEVDVHLALESGWDLDKTLEYEALRKDLGWYSEYQSYGIGSYLVTPPWETVTRDNVQAVYKLSCTGGVPTMKFGGDIRAATGLIGKNSLPGDLRLYDSPGHRLIALRNESLPFKTYTPVTRLTSSTYFNASDQVREVRLSQGVLNTIQHCKYRIDPESIKPDPKKYDRYAFDDLI